MTDNSRINWLGGRMAEEGAEILLVLSQAFHNFQEINPVMVLSGFKNLGNAAALLGADGSLTVMVSPAWDGDRARERAPGAKVLASDDLAGTVIKELKKAKGKIGVAGINSMPARIAGPIRDRLGDRALNMDQIMVLAGACKTEAEIARARTMAEVAEKCFDRMLEFTHPGRFEFELAAELYRYSKELGADDNFLLITASQSNKAPRAAGRRVLEEGDLILGEITPGADGQFVQICRSAVIGPISPIQQADYDLLWKSMERGMETALPGRTVAEVTRAMDQVIIDGGYGEYCRPPYMRVRGHGLGSISHLPGDIGTDNHMELEEGMIFVMHPNQYLLGSGYLLCGEPVLITEKGAEPLTRRYSQLASIPVTHTVGGGA